MLRTSLNLLDETCMNINDSMTHPTLKRNFLLPPTCLTHSQLPSSACLLSTKRHSARRTLCEPPPYFPFHQSCLVTSQKSLRFRVTTALPRPPKCTRSSLQWRYNPLRPRKTRDWSESMIRSTGTLGVLGHF